MDEKEWTMVAIKGYVKVTNDVESETMRYIGKVWTVRQRNKRYRVNVRP